MIDDLFIICGQVLEYVVLHIDRPHLVTWRIGPGIITDKVSISLRRVKGIAADGYDAGRVGIAEYHVTVFKR